VLPSNDKKCDVKNSPVEITDKPPTKLIDMAYEHIVYWRFLVPSGNTGKKYVNETTKLINSFVDASAMKDLSMKALLPALLLQKPSKRSKAKEHSAAL